MKVKTVKVRVGVTKKTKVKFEMIRIDEELVIELEGDETAVYALTFGRNYLEKKIKVDVQHLIDKGV